MSFFSKLFPSKSSANNHSKSKTSNATAAPLSTNAPRSTYDELKLQANALLHQGKLEEAKTVYELALQENLFSCEAHVNLGYVLKELAFIQEAKLHLDKAIDLDSKNFDAHLLRAMLAIDESDISSAYSAIKVAGNLQPTSTEAHAILYRVHALRGEFSEIENHVKDLASRVKRQASHVEIAKVFSSIDAHGELKGTLLKLADGHLQTALVLDHHNVEALISQSLVYLALDQKKKAICKLEAAISADPSFAESYYTLGVIHKDAGEYTLALENLEKSNHINAVSPATHKALGDAYLQSAQYDKAVVSYKKAIELKPDMVDAYIMLGTVQCELGMVEGAIDSMKIAVNLRPDAPEVYFGLGNVLAAQNKYPQAVKVYEQALKLRPSYPSVQLNLGCALLGLGDHIRALSLFRTILTSIPSHLTALSNIAYCSSFDAKCSASEYLNNALTFGKVATSIAKPYTTWTTSLPGHQCLKVGLVSGDFCNHPVGFFLESVIAYLDSEKIELHAFSNRISHDILQRNLKSRFKSWTSIVGLSDEAAAKIMHDAQLDLLIDLSGHTAHNRLPVFAWRPAPVQAAWLGYWASTGVTEIEYILTDRNSVPLKNQTQFSEKVIYLPDTRLCFTPPSALYDFTCSPLPSVKQGYITFGSYQPIRKLTAEVLATWGSIYKNLPTSKFRLQGAGFEDPETSQELISRLIEVGIPGSHITLFKSMPRLDYLKSHEQVDIILDSFPYPGGTTTCDALWMGVPTVTFAGSTMLSRQGLSLLTCAGLTDWIAYSQKEYIDIAVAKARDINQLKSLRANLRKKVFNSPLFDAPGFAKHLEIALHTIVKGAENQTIKS